MRKSALSNILVGIGVSFTFSMISCVEDKNLDLPTPPDNSFTEEFDTVQSAYDRGWRMFNQSTPAGRLWIWGGAPTYPVYLTNIYPYDDLRYYPKWQQAESGLYYDPTSGPPMDAYTFSFPDAYSSKNTKLGYIASSWACNTNINFFGTPDPDPAYINNWLISPEVLMKNGDKIVFYSRCDTTARLQVRLNKSGNGSMKTGSTLEDAGDFTSLLLDVNPTYLPAGNTAYPKNWTRFEATVYGLDKPTKARFAFRHMFNGLPLGYVDPADLDINVASPFIEDLFDAFAKSVLGIDKVQFISK